MDDFNLYDLIMNEPEAVSPEVREAHELPDFEPYFEEPFERFMPSVYDWPSNNYYTVY